MEKIYFDDQTYIWRTQFDISHMKDDVLKECVDIMEEIGELPGDNFGFLSKWKDDIDFDGNFDATTKVDEIVKEGIKACITLFNENKKLSYNKINTDAWINVVRAKNPKQPNFSTETEIVMHTHTELNHANKVFRPDYTYVHYVQMPDNLEGKDGVLYVEGKDGVIHSILPKENDIIIMEAHIPHVPASARKSTKDRIVIAGNVGFELIKKSNSLI
jgi:hypothetical protein